MTDATNKPATLSELKAALPAADAEFLLEQLGAEATVDAAVRAWLAETKPKKKGDVLVWGIPIKQLLATVTLIVGAMTGQKFLPGAETPPAVPLVIKFYNAKGQLVSLKPLPAKPLPAAAAAPATLPPLPGDEP